MYCSVMSKVLHQLFKMNLNSVLLLLCTARIFVSVRSSVFNYYFCSICEILLHCFSDIVQIFWKWLFTIFRKYWYLITDKNNLWCHSQIYISQHEHKWLKSELYTINEYSCWSMLTMIPLMNKSSYIILHTS